MRTEDADGGWVRETRMRCVREVSEVTPFGVGVWGDGERTETGSHRGQSMDEDRGRGWRLGAGDENEVLREVSEVASENERPTSDVRD